ncbi:MAG TPA: DUF4054 domain-containing protein [Rhizobium sp.]
MGVVVTFDYAAWAALFPQFSNLSEAQVTGPVLVLAEQYSRNDGGGPVCNAAVQTQLLNLMVAHIAQLLYGSATQPVSALVGRVSSATEGSVSVGTEFPTTPQNAWYLQTPFGAAWWQLSLPYRLGRYFPKVTQQRQITGGGWGPGW